MVTVAITLRIFHAAVMTRKVACRNLDTAVADDAALPGLRRQRKADSVSSSAEGVASRPARLGHRRMALDPKAASRARPASVRLGSARRLDRRHRVRPARRAARRARSPGRRPHRRSGLARPAARRRARGVRVPAGATGRAAGRARRAGQAAAPHGDMSAGRRCKPAGPPGTPPRATAAQSRSRRAAAALSRRGQGAHRRRARRRDRLCRAAGLVLVEPFLRLGRQGQRAPDLRRLRARGDPRPCARPLRRHAAGGRDPSGDADLSRQCALDRPELGRRHAAEARPQRESRARDPGAAYARRAQRSTRRTTSRASPRCSPAGP